MADRKALPFTTIQQGSASSFDGPSDKVITQVVKTQREWESLWHQHVCVEPPPPLPAVNFDVEAVVGVWPGEKRSGGFEVAVVEIAEKAGEAVIVTYQERSPPPGAICIMALTQPFHLVKMAKTDLPILFESRAAPPAPAGGEELTFLLTVAVAGGDAEKTKTQESVKAVNGVTNVKSMFSGGILCVQVNACVLEQAAAFRAFEGIDGVESVELDGAVGIA